MWRLTGSYRFTEAVPETLIWFLDLVHGGRRVSTGPIQLDFLIPVYSQITLTEHIDTDGSPRVKSWQVEVG